MDNETDHKLAESLTANTTDLIPFLPYLLQDFWELGSSPADMVELVKRHIDTKTYNQFLDLGCGKGAVAVTLAKKFGIHVTGVDVVQEFIDEAQHKSKSYCVTDLTHFFCDDIIKFVQIARGFDCVIYGAVGRVLGSPHELLSQLSQTIKPGGYILLDDAYIEDERQELEICSSTKYYSISLWEAAFNSCGLENVSYICENTPTKSTVEGYDKELSWIERRAQELAERYPQHESMFKQYVMNQRHEYGDLLGNVVGATWLLRMQQS